MSINLKLFIILLFNWRLLVYTIIGAYNRFAQYLLHSLTDCFKTYYKPYFGYQQAKLNSQGNLKIFRFFVEEKITLLVKIQSKRIWIPIRISVTTIMTVMLGLVICTKEHYCFCLLCCTRHIRYKYQNVLEYVMCSWIYSKLRQLSLRNDSDTK